MPYRRKDSPIWWASFTDHRGKRVRRSTETTIRKEAKALETKWKLDSYRTRQWDEVPRRTFEELMYAYLKATADEKRSANKDITSTRHLRSVFKGCIMNELTASDIRTYISKRKENVSNASINRELALFSAAINFANREWEWDLPNVVKGRKLKEPPGRARWISVKESVALLDKARGLLRAPHLHDFILLALYTGCRSQEMLGLTWSRVDLQAEIFYLEPHQTKTGRRRSIPLNSKAMSALEGRADFRARFCPDSPWVFCNKKGERIQSVKKSFATACSAAGIEDFRIHDMRHTCAAWLVSAGAALAEVRDLLGHASITMTERYAHLSPENVRNALSLIDGNRSRYGHAVSGNKKADANATA
ncbi:MAG TPA: site-specific integrase [Gammaproteobacteria bacterium]|nr:tyrosine recombinase XerC [bacterium BMS3Abin11]HDH15151.1 site-specific integrase [Gammaproteobacteria bacterium]